MYHVPFCTRRLALVLCFFLFKNSTQHQFLYGTLATTSFYIIYIAASMPHIENFYNIIELFNEITFILITYTFFGFHLTDIEPILSSDAQWKLGYCTFGLISIVYVVNFVVMMVSVSNKIKWLYRKVKYILAKKSAKEAAKKTKRKSQNKQQIKFDEESAAHLPNDEKPKVESENAVSRWRRNFQSLKVIAQIIITNKDANEAESAGISPP